MIPTFSFPAKYPVGHTVELFACVDGPDGQKHKDGRGEHYPWPAECAAGLRPHQEHGGDGRGCTERVRRRSWPAMAAATEVEPAPTVDEDDLRVVACRCECRMA